MADSRYDDYTRTRGGFSDHDQLVDERQKRGLTGLNKKIDRKWHQEKYSHDIFFKYVMFETF